MANTIAARRPLKPPTPEAETRARERAPRGEQELRPKIATMIPEGDPRSPLHHDEHCPFLAASLRVAARGTLKMRPRPVQSLIASRLAILSWLELATQDSKALGDGMIAERGETLTSRDEGLRP